MTTTEIYHGPFLSINFEFENDCFVQRWETKELSIDSFKAEMLEYLSQYKIHQPSKTLWLHENFTLQIDSETFNWIEIEINIPCKKLGNKMLAFVVGQDLAAHLTVINSFKESNSCITVAHFGSELEARKWLTNEDNIVIEFTENDKRNITNKGLDSNGNCIIELIVPNNEMAQTLSLLQPFIEKNIIIEDKKVYFDSLTLREKEILHLYSLGRSINAISKELDISEHTVRTHWKSIKFKLDISSHIDVFVYTNAFM